MFRCDVCHMLTLDRAEHRCAPLFSVRFSSEGEEEWVSVHAFDPEHAAEEFVSMYDRDGDYGVLRGEEAEVLVKDDGGEITTWIVTGESVPQYSARET